MSGLFDLPQSRAERDRALARVEYNAENFNRLARAVLRNLKPGYYTGEDIRRLISKRGYKPHHHNAWGALIRWALQGRILSETGEYEQMRDVKSHARRTPLYRKKS
jgi:hypothetical protein